MAKFETEEPSSSFEHAMGFTKHSIDMCAVANTKGDRVGVHGVGWNGIEVLGVAYLPRNQLSQLHIGHMSGQTLLADF